MNYRRSHGFYSALIPGANDEGKNQEKLNCSLPSQNYVLSKKCTEGVLPALIDLQHFRADNALRLQLHQCNVGVDQRENSELRFD